MPCAKNLVARLLPLVLSVAVFSACSAEKPVPPPPPAPVPSAPGSTTPDGGSTLEPETLSSTPMANAMSSLTAVGAEVSFNDGTTLLQASVDDSGNCAGQIRGKLLGGGKMLFRVEGKDVAIRGDAAFWRHEYGTKGKRLQEVLGDRWLLITYQQFGSYATYCSFHDLLAPAFSSDRSPEYRVLWKGDLDGEPVVKVQDGESQTFAWISKANNRLLRLDREDGTTVRFMDFNRAVHPDYPPIKDLVRLSDLS